MKSHYGHQIGLARLCGWFGITRQAYYQHQWRVQDTSIEQYLVLQQVKEIRQVHPRMGVRKLYELLEDFMLENQIKMGRDALFSLLADHNLLVRKRKKRVHTTNSFHWLRKYPNLTEGFVPKQANELWVSDITYWKIETGYLYISLITDAFSHKIVGYNVGQTLKSNESLKALEMALLNFTGTTNLIHHSDRGIQYCSSEYVELLEDYNIQISMTQSGDPLENPIAERINGILKDEYLMDYEVKNIHQAKQVLESVVNIYNQQRPHMSIGNLTPGIVHQNNLPTKKLWKNYFKKNSNLVKVLQDQEQPVNLMQD